MLRFGKAKAAKEEFHGAKKLINIWDVNVGNVVISNLIETRNNSKYLVGYLDEKVKNGDKDKNNKFMSFCINDEKLLETYTNIWTKIKDLKNTKLNTLPVF